MVTATQATAPCLVSAQVAEVEQALRALVAAPAEAELAATEVVRLLALRALLATAISDRLSIVENGHGWARDGSVTPAAWLRRAAELSRAEASAKLRLSRRLRDLPLVRGALADAQLSAEHAQVLGAHLSALPADLREAQEQPFIDLALLTDPHTLDIELRKRCQALQPLPADVEGDRQHAQRRLSLRQTFGGMWQLSGLLDPDSGEIVSVALTALRRTDQHTGDLRTPSQRPSLPGQRCTARRLPGQTAPAHHLHPGQPARQQRGAPGQLPHQRPTHPAQDAGQTRLRRHPHPARAGPRRTGPGRRPQPTNHPRPHLVGTADHPPRLLGRRLRRTRPTN